jgi:hypothetical protein
LTQAATLHHTFGMFALLHSRWMVPWLAVCVLLLFFFPLVHGPFQATHGPNTAFRSRRALLALMLLIIQAGTIVFSKLRASVQLIMEGFTLLFEFLCHGGEDAFDRSIMRC